MAKKQKKNDPYAICTAQKKKSGMGHDAWKRCVQQLQQKESVMNFYEKVKLLEKRTKRNEKMQNKLPDGPPQAGRTPSDEEEAELDAEDTLGEDDDDGDEPTPEELAAIEKEQEDEADSGTARIASQYKAWKEKQKSESKKGMKEGGAYGLGTGDSDDEDEFNYERDIPAHIRGKAAARVKHERELELAKQRQEKDPDDDDDKPITASKKSKMKEAKKGKKDDKWIQKAVDPDHEGYCTPMTKKTCTPARKALAKTFKKMGRARDRKIKAKDEK